MDLGFIPLYLHTFESDPSLHRLLILIYYIIVVKVADLLIDRVLRKLAARTSITMDDEILDFLHRPVCWTIFWVGIGHALLIEPLHEPWQTVLPSLTKSMILGIWIYAAIKIFNWVVAQKLNSHSEEDKIGRDVFLLLKNLVRVVIIASGLLWLLTIWKINLTPLFASAGIVGIAIALAAKDTLANFFGGVSVFMDKAYKLGDYIILDSGERGEVMEIGIRSTRIKTRDDVLITIPNSLIANAKIINESAPIPRFRIRVPLGVAYGSNLDKVEQVLLEVARDNPNVSTDPEPRVRYRSFGDSSVSLELLCWVDNPALKGLEIHNILKAVYRALAENQITIPFPQRDVHFIHRPALTRLTEAYPTGLRNQSMPPERDEYFMGLALAQAREALEAGEFPVGCVIAADDRVVAEGRRTHSRGQANELDHAEVVALRELLSRDPEIGRTGLTVYSTMEPCLMCFATLLLNGIRRLAYGYEDVMGGATGLDLANLAPLYREIRVEVVPHLRRAESLALFQEFFTNPANGYWQGSLLAEYTLAGDQSRHKP